MNFYEVLDQVVVLLRQRGRLTYRALKYQFQLDDDGLEALKEELIEAQRVAADDNGKVLVWVGAAPVLSSESRVLSSKDENQTPEPAARLLDASPLTPSVSRAEGERRQLTVMFCDLVGSTALSQQLDPEELRAVIQAYRETCATVIRRFDGYLAKYIGDGLLVYFGYPVAHEDDAQRAVRAGLGIAGAISELPLPPNVRLHQPLQVRIGIHTGLVVAGEMGTVDQPEHLAIVGETPNLAARLQEKAAPNSVVISPTTSRLVTGLFECQELGPQPLKGISTPLVVYRVVRESTAQSRFEVAVSTGLTPLVGRTEELELLQRRWAQVQDGDGQVVLLSGEPGIGKSRLVQALKEQVLAEGAIGIEFRCSPYHQNSALYPIIEHLQRLLQFTRADAPAVKLEKLQHLFSRYRFPQTDTFPLLAALLSLPHPEDCPPLTISPQKQKEKLQAALVAWLLEEAERRPVYIIWEDMHWVDPSTLEVVNLVVDQAPTARLYMLLAFRSEFMPPWGNRSHLSQLTLSRLGRSEVEAMVERVTGGKALPPEVVQQIVTKTDGVPLFVEELTKTVVESMGEQGTGNREQEGNFVGAQHAAPVRMLGVPTTLQDALMARLDRLGPAKETAQLGATLGRDFSYELLHAVSLLDEAPLQQGLQQLVKAELVYQRGLLPQAHYLFKHALIRDTAYQSLLKSTRQQLHRQIAQVLEGRFPETVATQPELVADHYTEAGFSEQAVPYWQQAGQRAAARSAHVEAVTHLTKGLTLLKTLPDTPERVQQELTLQLALGGPLMFTKGLAAPEAGAVHTRVLALCQQIGETPQLIPALSGAWFFYLWRAELQTVRELAEQLLSLVQRVQDPALLQLAHRMLAEVLSDQGEGVSARAHFEQALALYDPEQRRALIARLGFDNGANSLALFADVLWVLGYPDQARTRSGAALTLVQENVPSIATYPVWALNARLHQYLCEAQAVQRQAETLSVLCHEQGVSAFSPWATISRGWALAMQGQTADGLSQIHQGLTAARAAGTELFHPYHLSLLAEAYGKTGQAEEGLAALAEAIAAADKTEERWWEAELYRLKGELTLQQENQKSKGKSQKSKISNTQHPTPSTQAEVEACFLKAIEIAQKQQAKSLELRAVMSLARLWQSQGKHHAARNTLSEIYGWFTEGFDTKDLQEARALLDELSH